MDGVVEVITGRERRRRWSVDEKLRIVAETQEPGMRVRDVAARHGLCESLVFTWRRQARQGVLIAPEMPVFMPVQLLEAPVSVAAGPAPPALTPPAASRPHAGLIEIELHDGSRVRVGDDVSLTALRRVISALRG